MIILVIILISIVFPGSALAKANIGYVDTVQILEKYPKAQKALKDLQVAEESLRKKLVEQRQILAKPENQKKTETEKRLLVEKFKAEIEPEAERLEAKSKAQSKEIEKELETAITKVASNSKYDLILIKQAILWGGKDVSDEVIKELSKS